MLLKHVVKQDRPDGVNVHFNSSTATYSAVHGNGYGFPSSHSQYMGYFATFLACHMYFTYRFSSTGSAVLDALWRFIVYSVLYSWAGAVAYSRFVLRLCIFLYELDTYRCARYYLGYHNEYQILWGLAIGATFGIFVYVLAEFIPTRRPHSLLGRFKTFLLINPVSTWFQLRDGWAVWPDGGREDEWVRWRKRWDQQRKRGSNSDKRIT